MDAVIVGVIATGVGGGLGLVLPWLSMRLGQRSEATTEVIALNAVLRKDRDDYRERWERCEAEKHPVMPNRDSPSLPTGGQ